MSDAATSTTALDQLWCLRSFGLHQRVDPRVSPPWYFNNRGRIPGGAVILQYAVRGKMFYRDPHGSVDVPAGHAALFTMDEESEYGIRPDFPEIFSTQFFVLEGAGLLEHCNALRRQFGSVFYLGDDHPVLLSLRELCQRPSPRSTAEACLNAVEIYSVMMRLYTWLDQRHARAKPPVERAIDELMRHAIGSVSLKEIAQRQGCSREHLTRVFSERVGTSPARFLKHAKLLRALELLRETRLPVQRIAEQCGFASKHTLARLVRVETGDTPSAYRFRMQQRRA